jgi:hypothetical protein
MLPNKFDIFLIFDSFGFQESDVIRWDDMDTETELFLLSIGPASSHLCEHTQKPRCLYPTDIGDGFLTLNCISHLIDVLPLAVMGGTQVAVSGSSESSTGSTREEGGPS